MNAPSVDKNSDRAQSLHKGLLVLQSFSDGRAEMTLSEVAENVGLNLATTRRFLLTLVDLGYLSVAGKRYSLTPKVLTLGYNYLSNLPWWQLANPVAEDISRRLNESCSIGVLSKDQLIIVARAQGPRELNINLSPGRVVPVHTVSIGRVLLAELSDEEISTFFLRNPPVALTPYTITDVDQIREALTQVKQQGYAVVDQELDIGLLAIAVPIRDSRGIAVAAIGVSTQTERQSREELLRVVLPILQDGAKRIGYAV
ncbi:IclR family transcriptional regulator [Marinobacterium zhoushanense]|jgi:IclR family pca regulon transcriptional regulator|uniref:IclR family transcriptional regulator n=1 Tax=Marinobacterium zhoushanense TaxID=1679163 RepID=A0ABQ1K477_9GAMM|nr:IclR family transcriptional regulator C-terminal domain-containing protein [Marinobacterium zhoushanense]GGB87539.1 IclR family transcriptional regulator [Marinobacterium zhoushanense]